MARNYAALPHEYLGEMEELSDAEFGRLCRALLLYSMTGQETQLQGAERFLLRRVYMQERRFQESYDVIARKRSEAGKAGAEKRWGKKSMANAINDMANDSKAMANHSKNSYTKTETDTNTETNMPPPKGGRHRNPPVSPLRGASPELQAAFAEWLRYKSERHQTYKPTGLKTLEERVREAAAQYGDQAVIGVIRDSIANNWQGLFFDRLEKQRPARGGNVFLEMLEEEHGQN